MLPKAQVSHHSPGRTRLRIPEHKRDAEFLTATGRKLAVIPGIARAAVNATTGSILLEHELSLEDLQSQGRERALFILEELPRAERPSKTIAANVNKLMQRADERIQELSAGELDGRLVVAGGLFGLSLLQFRRGDFLPAGMMLALMAVGALKS